MRHFSTVCSLILLAAQAAAQNGIPPAGEPDYRLVNLPPDKGCSNLKSQLIDSQAKLDAFVKEIAGQKDWMNREIFLKRLDEAKLDFAKELLVLIRFDAGAGETKIELGGDKDKIVLVIDAQLEGGFSGHIYAIAVRRGKATEVEVWEAPKGVKAKKAKEILRLPAK